MIVLDGVWTPIMSQPIQFHGDVGGTRDAYGHDMGRESLFRPPSSNMIWRRSLCARLVERVGETGGCPPFRVSIGGEGVAALSLARVGTCADELRLMGVERDEVPTEVGRAVWVEGSLSKKSTRACGPPAMERMRRGPWGDGASWTMQFVKSSGRLSDRRGSLVGRLVSTKGSSS